MPDPTTLAPVSPLGSRPLPFERPGISLVELPGVAKVRIQVSRPDFDQLEQTGELLPAVPNTALGSQPWILWRAPGDWFAYATDRSPAELENALAARLGGSPFHLADVSSGSTLLELSGQLSVDVLMRDLTLDLEGDAIPSGACAQTTLAQLTVLIHRIDAGEDPHWRLFVDRTAARHLWEWLVDSAELVVAAGRDRAGTP